MQLDQLEMELKKRWKFPYKWGRKQANDWDYKTNFIYKIKTFDELLKTLAPFEQDIKDYAMNRWYNFWSAMAVEHIFAKHPMIIPNKNKYDKLIDFTINSIPFDHKTSVFPRGFNKSLFYAQQNPKELIKWLYDNQSQQGRKHVKNRLFIVLFYKNGAHWKLKAELFLLKEKIDQYCKNFDSNLLPEFNFEEGKVLSDIIWLIKN